LSKESFRSFRQPATQTGLPTVFLLGKYVFVVLGALFIRLCISLPMITRGVSGIALRTHFHALRNVS